MGCSRLGVGRGAIDLKARRDQSRKMNSKRHCLLVLLMVFGHATAWANWADFRGPRGDGHAGAGGKIGLPLHWSETNNIKWKTAIPHKGISTPVIMDGQVWLTSATP